MPRFIARIRFAHNYTPAKLEAKKAEMADAVAQQTRDRIAAGGDDDAPFAPLAFSDGKPLQGLLGRVQAFNADRGFGASVDSPGVRTLLYGATIEAKKGKALAFRAGGVLRFFKRVVIPPRAFLRLTAGNVKELGRVLVGRKT